MGGHRIKVLIKRFFGGVKNREIEPDEIFLDSSNLPEFNQYQFEGRIEKPIAKKMQYFVILVLFFVFISYIGRVSFLQIYKGDSMAYLSENNRLQHSIIFAGRGILYDRNGVELVSNEAGNEGFAFRKYINIDGLSHILGYVGYPLKDSLGRYYQEEFIAKGGAELFFNDRLSGDNGLEIEEIDAFQQVKSKNTIRQPKDGDSVVLSIDANLNQALYNILKKRSEESGFVGGAGILMDVNSGEIIALTSFPEFNSQILTDGGPSTKISSYVEDTRKPFLNRIVSGLYTPGSIIKPIIALGALSEGVITPEKKILSTGSIKIPHPYIDGEFSVFVDWKAHGYVDIRQAIANSSNVYFYEVGGGFEDQDGIGIDGINKYAELFGFGEETGSPFTESKGLIPNPEWKAEVFNNDPWRLGDTYNTSIGQYGFQVTPIQVVRAIGAIANGGILVTPTLEKGVYPDKEKLIINEDFFRIIREGMRMGVEEGTASALNNPYVKIAAKTGTAQLGTTKKFVNSWVTGFFPYENPKYAFAIIMERGPEANLIGAPSVMRNYIEWINTHAPEYFNNVN